MPKNAPSDWFATFFHGMALEFWRRAMTPEMTAADADFLVEALALRPGARVLDVPCGDGRLALELAGRGYTLTGVDLAREFLADARRAARARKLAIDWHRGDMRELPGVLGSRARFDAAFCFGNSFAYFDRAGVAAFLAGVAKALRSGGRFVIDTGAAAESLLPQLDERIWMPVGDLVMLAENDYDAAHSRLDTTFTFMQGARRETGRASQWVFTVGELCALLAAAGLRTVELWSDLQRTPFALGAQRLLLVAEKARLTQARRPRRAGTQRERA
jgi:SAM-dependent methyltransferase